MLCSTIIPTINRPTLMRAIKSVLDQDLNSDQQEIIIVNDSGESIPEYDWLKFPSIKVIQTNHVERCLARNVGAAIANGTYLRFLDDDDYLIPKTTSILIRKAESSGCSWVYGALNRVDDNNELISINRPDVRGNLYAHITSGDCLHLGASLIKREDFLKVGGFDPSIIVAEDRDIQRQFALLYDFDRIDDVVANIRIGESGNTSSDWNKKGLMSRIIRERALDANGSYSRIRNSIGNNDYLRGRCVRVYLISAILNIMSGRVCIAANRLFYATLLVGFNFFRRDFLIGVTTRSYWHRYEKANEEKKFDLNSKQNNK